MALPNRNPLNPPALENASADQLEARRVTLEAVRTAVAELPGPGAARDAQPAIEHLGEPEIVEVELPTHLIEAIGHLAQRAGVSADVWLTTTLVWAIADEIDLGNELTDTGKG